MKVTLTLLSWGTLALITHLFPVEINCIGSPTSDTATMENMIQSFNGANGVIELPAQNRCVLSNLSIPSNISIRATYQSAGIEVVTSSVLKINGKVEAPADKQIFFNALPGQGSVILNVTPHAEWFAENTVPGTTDMSGAIESAIHSVPIGSAAKLQLLGTKYGLAPHLGELILIDRNVSLVGMGAQSTVIIPAADVDSSTDIIHITPIGDTRFLTISNLSIKPPPGIKSGRHGIHIDISSSGSLANSDFSQLYIERMNADSIHESNPIPNLDGFFTSRIHDNFLTEGGINLQNSGDSISITDNTIAGSNSTGIVLSNLPGAVKPLIRGNNITALGGAIDLRGGNSATIIDNNLEQPSNPTNGATSMISIIGQQNVPIINAVVENNSINGRAKISHLLTLDYVRGTVILNNTFQKGVDESLAINSNAIDTRLGNNQWGDPEIFSVLDNGVGTRGITKSLNLIFPWVNNGGTVSPATSTKDFNGNVRIGGYIYTTLRPTLPMTIFTLPIGHRPSYEQYLIARGSIGLISSSIDVVITTDGRFIVEPNMISPMIAPDFISLSSLPEFKSAPTF